MYQRIVPSVQVTPVNPFCLAVTQAKLQRRSFERLRFPPDHFHDFPAKLFLSFSALLCHASWWLFPAAEGRISTERYRAHFR